MATIPIGRGVPQVLPDAQQNRVITMDTSGQARAAQQVADTVQRTAYGLLDLQRREDQALTRVKASNALLTYESQLESGVTDLGAKLSSLELQPENADAAYQQFVTKLDPIKIPGLDTVGQEELNLSMRKLQAQKRQQLQEIIQKARVGVARSELRSRFDALENASTMPDADLGKIFSRVQEEGIQQVGRAAFGVDGWDKELRTFQQSAYTANALGRIHQAGNDTAKLQQIYADVTNWQGGPYQGLAAKGRESLLGTLRPLLDRSVGIAAGQQAVAGGDGAAGGLFSALIQAESSGQQFDSSGAPLTSSKGAVGVAQIMPDTGPEAAQAAGLPWDEKRFRTDPGYNRALGEGLFNKLLQTYDGNQALAVAAYNAGPGRVQEWIERFGDPRKGEITDDDFIKRIPFQETRDYTRKVIDQAARQQTKPEFGPIAQAIDARTDLSPEQKRIAISDARQRFEWQQDEQKQRYAVGLENAWNIVLQGGRWQEIDPSVWAGLTAEHRKSLMGYRPNRPTDPETYIRARDLIMDGKEVNLLGMRNMFSDSDFTRLVDLQLKTQAGGGSATASISTGRSMFNDALRMAGIPTSPKAGSKDAKQKAKAEMYVDEQIRNLEQEQGKKASHEQIQQIIDNAFIKGTILGSGMFFNDTGYRFELAPGQRMKVTDIEAIPAGERKLITEALKRHKKEIDDLSIIRLFNEANQ